MIDVKAQAAKPSIGVPRGAAETRRDAQAAFRADIDGHITQVIDSVWSHIGIEHEGLYGGKPFPMRDASVRAKTLETAGRMLAGVHFRIEALPESASTVDAVTAARLRLERTVIDVGNKANPEERARFFAFYEALTARDRTWEDARRVAWPTEAPSTPHADGFERALGMSPRRVLGT